jgi:regulator of replication initiation timing
MAQHRTTRGPLNHDPTIGDVFKEVDRVDQKLDRVLNELDEIKQTLNELPALLAQLQQSVDEQE